MPEGEVTLLAEMVFKSPLEPADMSALEAVVEATRAEPGCRAYAAHVHADDPRRVLFHERWADQGALDRHWASKHLRIFREHVTDRVAAPPTLTFWRRLG